MKRTILILFVLLIVSAVSITVFSFSSSPAQPIKYSHKVHIDQGLECDECHIYVKTQAFASIPKISQCLECHDSAITESKEEEKIRTIASQGGELKWEKVFTLPSHVFFSHRRHVVAGEVECVMCHGEMWTLTEPPKKPLKTLVMEDCIDCHKKRNAAWDCLDCHK